MIRYNKHKRALRIFLIINALVLFGQVSAQQNNQPFFKTYQVAGKVHMLQAPNAGGNIGVFSGEDGVLLIDDRFDQDTAALLEAVAAITDKKIEFLVNTHIHPDHIGGNNNLAAHGVLILAHDSVRLRMLKELRIPRRGGITFPQPPEAARPVITYSDAISFHLNGEEVRIFLAPPAHTDGDSFVYFTGSDVLHLGDVFRTNMYPIIDKFNGGSFLGMIEAMGIAIGMAGPNTKVIPGHGEGFTDRAGMLEVHDLLTTIRDRVQILIDQGSSLEQILAAAPTADLDERWGQVPSWNAADLLPIVFQELSE
ncbi:MAG: MBL fold metallo-hydrolase [SAR86 cluster bacterium]|uniref:MBL fold metallo-hydrolase n=1 Tax=SAR86 cluster bacterium TaxID=2030880 RepID=A0A2A5B5Q7_9GAMM|nr:MAG: MBL fold metallo-hydrolase [SAR86 cluster bacterium]